MLKIKSNFLTWLILLGMGLGKKFAIIISLKDTSYPPLVPSVELVRGATP